MRVVEMSEVALQDLVAAAPVFKVDGGYRIDLSATALRETITIDAESEKAARAAVAARLATRRSRPDPAQELAALLSDEDKTVEERFAALADHLRGAP